MFPLSQCAKKCDIQSTMKMPHLTVAGDGSIALEITG